MSEILREKRAMPKACFRTHGEEMWAWGQRSENDIPELSCHPLWWGTGSLCPAIAGTWGTGSETLLPLFGKCVIVAFNRNRTCEASLLEHPYRLSHGHAEWSSFKVTKKETFIVTAIIFLAIHARVTWYPKISSQTTGVWEVLHNMCGH